MPANDTINMLVYKQLRLLPLEYEVCALRSPEDAKLRADMDSDPSSAKFSIHYAGDYNDVLFSINNINLIKGLNNIHHYVHDAVSMYHGQKFLYTGSFPCYTTRVGVELKKAHPELIWIASFSDPINHSPYKFDRETYQSYIWAQKIAFKLYCRYYVCDQDEANAFEQADWLVFICEEQRDFMIQQYLAYFGKISREKLLAKSRIVPLNYVPEWNILKPGKAAPHDGSFTLSHFGRVYGLRIIREFIFAVQQFTEKHPSVPLRIEQYGEFRPADSRLIRQLHLESCFHIFPKIPYEDCIQKMISTDAVLLFDTILPEDQIQPYLPSKIVEYSLLQKNVLGITTSRSPSYRIMRQSNAIVCRYDRSDILAGLERLIIQRQPSLIQYAYTNEEAVQPLMEIVSPAE